MAEPGSHTKKSSEDQRKNLLQMYVLLLESTQWRKKKKKKKKKKLREILGKYIPFANTWRWWYHKSKPAITTVFLF